jgi:serine-type D-Ala-D-Ala carboxypeptidase
VLEAIADQELRFARAFVVLEEAVTQRGLPGASLAVLHRGALVALKGIGRFTYEQESPEVTAETIFDLASLTKVLATTTMAMLLYQRGALDLDTPVVAIVPEFAPAGDPRRREVTIRMLLAHSSGLPAYERLFERAHTRDDLIQAALAVPLTSKPGARAEYSDVGFVILGEALAQIADEPLDSFCRRNIFGPLGMRDTGFCPPRELRARIPPTEDDRNFRHKIIQGEVNDENAWVLGGVAGHAGAFATARDVAAFAACMLSGGAPILRRETVELFTRRESSPAGTSRALGWDTPSHHSSSGQYFSSRAFGHLGFTGTSLWIDPEEELAVVLLTNRTWPDRKSQFIKQVRPRFHDAVVESLR